MVAIIERCKSLDAGIVYVFFSVSYGRRISDGLLNTDAKGICLTDSRNIGVQIEDDGACGTEGRTIGSVGIGDFCVVFLLVEIVVSPANGTVDLIDVLPGM
ncbi:unnamed protein product [Vicia faba]|uniref:Uncharacterized protein n=1 Tax=Vicia faba TaxID=3906 RepID=A0AAV1AE01_VICFA|nr:unnamed protein product [Vicia faba]